MISRRLLAAILASAFAAPAYDYYISPTGSDLAAGTQTAPWQSLNKISAAIIPTSGKKKVFVASGTYNKASDYVVMQPTAVTAAAELEVTFGPGCVMDGTAANAIAPTNGWDAGGTVAWTCTVNGNGLVVQNYREPTASSPNGFGNRGYHVFRIYGVTVQNCDDGFSAHENSKIYTYDCIAYAGEKSAFLHIDTSYCEHWRTTFYISGLNNGFGSGTPTIKLFDCKVIPLAAGAVLATNGMTISGGRIGSIGGPRVQLVSTTNANITNAYINAYIDGNASITLTECYGKLTTRMRNASATGIRIIRCIFTGGATGSTNSVLSNEFNPGSQSGWSAVDSILTGYSTAIGMGFTSLESGYFVAAGNYAANCCLYGNTVNVDADLIAAGANISGTITSNPLLGPCNSYSKADWAVLPGSPCIGAGTSGGNIGFV